jgi:predicted SprT family Zn-dependent metalloprotease
MNQTVKKPRTVYPPIVVGNTYESLTILEYAGVNARAAKLWKVQCTCGTVWTAAGREINRGDVKRCRACGNKKAGLGRIGKPSGRRIDITGHRFNMLTAVSYAKTVEAKSFWLFRCDCGTEKVFRTGGVRRGDNYSCGCTRKPYTVTAPAVSKKAEKPRNPSPPKPKKEASPSPWDRSTPRFEYLQRQTDPEPPPDGKTALILASRNSNTKWGEIASLVDLSVDECKARYEEATR